MEKSNKNYINNKIFYEEICKYHETGKVSEKLWLKFWKLADNYSHLKCFNGYSYLEDMKSEAMIRCVKYVASFDHINKKNPFAYFTTVIHNSFLQFITKEKRQQSRKWKMMKMVYEDYLRNHNINIQLNKNIKEKMYGEK